MAQWRIELGDVVHWDDVDLKNEIQSISIDYNSNNKFPCVISTKTAEYIQSHESIELTVTYYNKDKNQVEICGELYILNDFQLNLLRQYSFYWVSKENTKDKFPNFGEIFDRNFGLVLFYDKDKHNYTMAELLIEFEESEPFKGKMTVYIFSDDTRLLINRYQSFFTDFKFEFIGVKDNGLQHYKLGDWNFMLTQAQAQKLCGLYSQMEEK